MSARRHRGPRGAIPGRLHGRTRIRFRVGPILITLPLWLIANVILRKRGQAPVFWVLALVTSLIEPAEQLSLVAGHLGTAVALVLGVAAYGMNVFEALLFWRYGLLAPLFFRLSYYLVWHVVGSVLGL